MKVRAPASPVAQTMGVDSTSEFGVCRPDALSRVAWALATAGGLSPALRKAIRKRYANRRSGPFDVTVSGVRFRAYPAENRCDRVLVGRRALPELEEHEMLSLFVGEGMVFVDIGANIGTYALWAAKRVGRSGTVIALEPHPRTFAKLEFNRAANGAANVTCLNLAAGPAGGSTNLWFDGGGNVGGASLLPDTSGGTTGTTVTVKPLSDILQELSIPRIDVVKVDVEGYEDRALLGYFETSPEEGWPATLMIETVLKDRWERDCLEVLASRGYHRIAATAENVILHREI